MWLKCDKKVSDDGGVVWDGMYVSWIPRNSMESLGILTYVYDSMEFHRIHEILEESAEFQGIPWNSRHKCF